MYVRRAGAMSAYAFIIMAMVIVRTFAGQTEDLIVIRAAGFRVHGDAAAGFLLMCAAAMPVVMAGMYVLAGHSLNECGDETASAVGTGMHIKTDDAHQVPSQQQSRTYPYSQVLHTNRQRYKFMSKTQNSEIDRQAFQQTSGTGPVSKCLSVPDRRTSKGTDLLHYVRHTGRIRRRTIVIRKRSPGKNSSGLMPVLHSDGIKGVVCRP